jgi:dTDP-4-dehydrorhamnose 3,5-epimerase
MKIIETKIEGLLVLEPKIFFDERGYFFESFNKSKVGELISKIDFIQDNEAKSTKGALRGLHYQLPPMAQTKLVRAVVGEVLDVVVDIRPHSPTYGQSFSLLLNDINKKMLFVPKGMAHGYITLSEEAIFAYKCDNYYAPSHEGGIHPLDSQLKIDWILDKKHFILSEKDKNLPAFGNHLSYGEK